MSVGARRAVARLILPVFGERFVDGRIEGFQKDMQICLTGVPGRDRSRLTHAYFPALGACCSMLEYLAGLHSGRLRHVITQDVNAYATKYLVQPDYDSEMIRLLVDFFRNTVNH